MFTNEAGHFIFEALAPSDTWVPLTFNDPNKDDPALAFRYVNQWNEPVVIEAYEMNGIQVPEQHLNDTEIVSIDEGITLKLDEEKNEMEIGLMQGFLTMPVSDEIDFFIWSYVDLDHQIGKIRNWENKNNKSVHYMINPNSALAVPGTNDQHQGVDFNMALGSNLISMSPGFVMMSRDEFHYFRIQENIGLETYVYEFGHK